MIEEIIQTALPYVLFGGLGLAILVNLLSSIRIVPATQALIVERLGRYRATLDAGFHLLLPFFDRVRYSHNLKETALEVPDQDCFTKDNVKIKIGGILYLRVDDPKKASYGIQNYRQAAILLAQTTMRSVIGLLDLDKTFEERDNINAKISQSLDDITELWGIKVTRYEIQNITVPKTILVTMELQVKAERDKRALIAKSLGEMNSRINNSVGIMEQAINISEGEKMKLVNEAEGKSSEILALSQSTANSITLLAKALSVPGGAEATELQITDALFDGFSKLASKNTQITIPMDLTNLSEIMKMIQLDKK